MLKLMEKGCIYPLVEFLAKALIQEKSPFERKAALRGDQSSLRCSTHGFGMHVSGQQFNDKVDFFCAASLVIDHIM